MRVLSLRLFLIVLFVVVFFNEYLIYILKAVFLWPTISCDESCTKLLIVADPQILGERKENVFTRFDSDKFLRNTFAQVYDHVEPDGVLFLGDLLDEGSVANDDQFERYYNRFRHIFQLPKLYSLNVPVVFIPGDNDIGGEGDEAMQLEAANRFSKYFGGDDVVVIRNIRMFKVNRLLHTYPKAAGDSLDIDLNLALSHLPLTSDQSPFANEVIQILKPDFILSAHEHKSYAVFTLQEDRKQLYYQELKQNYFKNGVPTWIFEASRTKNFTSVTEFTTPTCSYRMGERDVGYGVLVHNPARPTLITYHMLWLPYRFVGLFFYLLLFIITSLTASVRWYQKYEGRSRKRYSHC